jgi:DUF4097 and DUF4098 domain-containing protein YvlB
MEKRLFEVQETPTLSILDCRGDFSVNGWTKSAVRVRAEDEQLEIRQEGETLMVTCRSDLRIDAPHDSRLQVRTLGGDARFKRIRGEISLDEIGGDLILSQVGNARIKEARGDLSARGVDGDLIVQEVEGDMSVRNVSGRLEVGRVGRDLGARVLMGDARAEHVQGDVRLRSAFTDGKEYRFKARGDIVARVPSNTNADFTLRSGRNRIRIKADLLDRKDMDHEVTGRLGDGGATVVLDAGRDMILAARDGGWGQDWSGVQVGAIGVEFGAEFASLAEEIASEVGAHMAELSLQLEEKLANIEVDVGRLDERAERVARRAQKQLERAAARLQRRAEREAEKVRRHAAKDRWKTASRSRRPARPEPAGDPVTDKERLTILNMVAEGKISVQEAESLLDALQGSAAPNSQSR